MSQGRLNLRVTDGKGNLLPCRIHIKQKDGSCWLPPDVRDPIYSETEAPDLMLERHFERYLHIAQGRQLQSLHMNHGSAEFPVPAEECKLYVFRGHEYEPTTESFAVKSGETIHKEVVLRRKFDMPAIGWFSGDMHTHFSRWQPNDDYVWGRLLASEDIYAVNNMVFKRRNVVEAPQYDYGPNGEFKVPVHTHEHSHSHDHSHHHHHHGHRVVASGEEFRDNDLYGHMIAAGINEVIEPISTGLELNNCDNYPLFSSVCDWAREQGGIAGWAHGGAVIKLMESLPIEAALGKLDFVENIQLNQYFGFMFWYRLLNCGIPLACTGGSDFPFDCEVLAPWYLSLGLDRTYVQVHGEFNYKNYLEGIRNGQTFATNGPLLFFSVNGNPPGARLALDAGDNEVTVEAKAICNYGLDCIEIVVNGGVVKRIEGKGGATELVCGEKIRLDGSSWMAVRTRGVVHPEKFGGTDIWNLHAHSSPVYCHVAGRPIGLPTDLTCMADCVRMLQEVYTRKGEFSKDHRRQEMLDNCKKAIGFYENALKAIWQ